VTQGPGGSTSHTGRAQYAIDYGVPIGTPVYAMRSGKVVGFRHKYPDTGGDSSKANEFNYVLIEHDNGYRSAYMHLKQEFNNQVGLKVGNTVNAGQLIGYSGNSGWSTGPHVHVEVHKPNNGTFGQTVPFVIESSSFVSDAGLKFIADHEGLRLNLYNDPAGHATIGIGHLVHLGPINGSEPSDFKDGITEQQAYDLLKSDVASAIKAVKDLITVPLNQQQFDALVSFTFNLGRGSLKSSDLRTRLNRGEYSAVPYELSRWVNGGGKKLPGLVKRRSDEGQLFQNGVYG